MKRIFSVLGILIVAIVGTFLLLPFVLSADTIRDSIAGQLESWTGRKVVIAGDAKLTVFPTVSMLLSGVSIANAEGMGDEPFVEMDTLGASVRLLPLLKGAVEIDRFVLIRPRINLAVDSAGRTNWQFDSGAGGTGGTGGTQPAPPTGRTEPAPQSTSPVAIRTVQIGEFRIKDGRIRYRDQRSGSNMEASAINTVMTWPALNSPAKANGSLVWQGEVIKFDAMVEEPVKLTSGGTSRAEMMLDTARGTVDLKGAFNTAVDIAIDGQIDLKVPSVRALARWFGTNLPAGGGLNDLNLNSKFAAGGTKFSFSNAKLSMDGNEAEGAIIIKLDQVRPLIQATLALSTLNLNPYFPEKAAANAPQRPSGTGGGAAGPANQDGTAINLDGLRAVNAGLRLSAGKIVFRNYALGSGAVTVALRNGKLTAQFADVKGYGGQLNGTLAADGSGAAPAFTANVTGTGVNLEPLLTDVAGFKRLSGTGNIATNLKASGHTTKALTASLSGTLGLTAAKGAVRGVDLTNIVQTLRSQKLEGWGSGTRDTKFDRFNANFNIARGIATNQDMLMTGPGLTVSGSGQINLPAEQLDYRISTRLLETSAASQSANPVVLLELPIIIRGPWSRPLIFPDPLGVLASPEVKQTIEDIGDSLKKKGKVKDLEKAFENDGIKGVLDALKGR